jgi:hypothetical protein
MHPTEFVTL